MRKIDGFRIGIKNGRNHFRDFALQKNGILCSIGQTIPLVLALGLVRERQ